MRTSAWIMALLFATIIAPKVHANEVTFTLDQNTCTGGCTPSPFATVDVTTAGQPANTVLVTETLTGATQYVKTGAGYALAFSVTGNPTLTIGSLTTNFSVGNALTGMTESRDGAGSFEYWIECSGCGNGASPPIISGPLSFTAEASGLTPASFEVLNSTGYYLASDVLAGKTGNVEANGFTVLPTPEPASLALFGTGILGIGLLLRKRIIA
jgi:PEP-CTERM motif